MASSEFKTFDPGDGIPRGFNDTVARAALANKVDKETGKGLSTNDYTTAEKTKLAGIAEGATANTGTVTAVVVNNTTYQPSNGIVNLGTIGGGSGGSTDHDFSHTPNSTVSGATCTVTFAANLRGSVMLTVSADLALTIACNNLSDNYIWIKNTGDAEVDILINEVTYGGNSVTDVYMPSDGIIVPAGNVCEIGIVCNRNGAFITSRNDLTL